MKESKTTFTWEELSLLNREGNAHVAVRGKVYDVTEFLARHPGGKDQLLIAAGRDVTVIFNSYHAFSEKADKILDQLYVGDLISNEFPTFPPEPGTFYKTVRQRVWNHFKETNQDPKFSWWMILRCITCLSVLLLTWIAQLTWLRNSSFPLLCVAAAMNGFTSALTAMIVVHDASHFAITHKPWVWKTVGSVHDILLGCSMYTWMNQHVLGHHPYTNIDGVDPDIHTSKEADLRRIKWTQKWLPRYVNQHIRIPIIYCLLGIKTYLQDFKFLLCQRNSTIRINWPSPSHLTIFFLGKISFIIFRVVVPLMVFPAWKFAILLCLMEFAASYWLALVFQISHVVSEVEWPVPDKDGKINYDWAELQILTTLDYATDNWFWNVFTGALNHQTAHHLFPDICQYYYPQITPIVRQTCKEFGLKYNYIDTFTEALGAHIQHLKRLGLSKDKPRKTKQG